MNFSSIVALCIAQVFASQADKACCPIHTLLTSWDFNAHCPILTAPNQNWFLYTNGEFVANDGNFTCGPNGGFLNSNPFTHPVAVEVSKVLVLPSPSGNAYPLIGPKPSLEHIKWLGFDINALNVPVAGQLWLEWEMSARVFNTVPNQFPPEVTQGPNDLRFGCGAACVYDFANYLDFDFYITNDRIYAVYERLPFGQEIDDYAAFTYAIPVAKRHMYDFHKLKIVLDDVTKSVRYYVGVYKVLEIFNIGLHIPGMYPIYDFGGTETLAFPGTVNIGLGTFTGVDFYPAATEPRNPDTSDVTNYPLLREALTNCRSNQAPLLYNPLLGDPSPASYWDPQGTRLSHHIWGQGAEVLIRSMSAHSVTSCEVS